MLDRSWLIVLLAGLAVGCGSAGHPFGAGGSGGSANGGAGGQGSCTQGDTRACLGPGACNGAQACGADGLWSQCDCGSGTGGTGGSTSLDGGPDASNGGSSGTGGSGTGGSGGVSSCTGTTYLGTQIQLDMYIMMDKSGSMTTNLKWNGVKTALTTFVNSGTAVAGIGVGLQFFPAGATCPSSAPCPTGCTDFNGVCIPDSTIECNVNSYLPPAVAIQSLPGVAQQIINAMNAENPNGGTPTLPALTSAEQASQAYLAQNPKRRVAIVLATDGEPNDCNSTVANVAAEAATGFNATPSVKTFVIGIGTSIANLDAIAQAGGTGTAFVVDSSGNVGQQFLDAMNKIRSSGPGCGYLLPTPPSGTIDLGKLNVLYTPTGGTSTIIPKVTDATKCGTGSGWYYQTNSPRIVLCPASCTTVKSGSNHIDIELDCPTKVK